ncbi:MAG TPA: bifunctional oligoribonuclease/PAP phosphatase NrnA [Opitutaceae bacterium]|nr:bifunctional oligoribonuclease/PAP phosphatase NrnA [Opitutaceae bacterium]
MNNVTPNIFAAANTIAFQNMLPLLTGQRIAVVGHARPDGDCIGSQVAVARVLRSRGLKAVCVNCDVVPRRLQFLVDDLQFVHPSALPAGDWQAIFVDCADQARAGEKALARFPKPFLNIDHHLSNVGYAQHNFVDVTAAATCEILAAIFLDAKLPIDRVTAQALFTGIMTDTGQFRFASTTRRTFKITAELIGLGATPAEIGNEVYERESFGKIKLLQHFLASLSLECGGRVCIGVLPQGVFEKTGSTVEDTEGMVDYARAIDGVEIGVLIEERPMAIKTSLRCKDQRYRVDQIAAQFGGGGHACAAGLNLKNITLEEFRPRLIAAIAAKLESIDASLAAS